MRRFGVLTLAIVFVMQHLLVVVMYASFEANRDYIAEVLCINKDKPKSNCDGYCFFMQKMKAADEQKSSATLIEKSNVEIAEIRSEKVFVSLLIAFPGKLCVPIALGATHLGAATGIDHPPRV